MMWFYVAFFLLMCGTLIWVTIRGKDAFPFSHYPMFSTMHDRDKVKVYRLALEQQDGKVIWWQSKFYRYPQFVGKKIDQFYNAINIDNDQTVNAFLLLQKNKLLLEVLRLLKSEHNLPEKYKAFHIIERRITENYQVTDKTIEIISFEKLINGRVS